MAARKPTATARAPRTPTTASPATPAPQRGRGGIVAAPAPAGADVPTETPTAPLAVLASDQADYDLLNRSLPQLRAELVQMEAALEANEAVEVEHCRTPLALRLEIVSCQLASEHWKDTETIPAIIFNAEVKCPYGKTETDQDCRMCSLVKLVPFGAQHPMHTRRYPHHPMVIPISRGQDEVIGGFLRKIGVTPAERPKHRVDRHRTAIAEAERRLEEIKRRALLAQQQGQF